MSLIIIKIIIIEASHLFTLMESANVRYFIFFLFTLGSETCQNGVKMYDISQAFFSAKYARLVYQKLALFLNFTFHLIK